MKFMGVAIVWLWRISCACLESVSLEGLHFWGGRLGGFWGVLAEAKR
jgi:hypothetical protein